MPAVPTTNERRRWPTSADVSHGGWLVAADPLAAPLTWTVEPGVRCKAAGVKYHAGLVETVENLEEHSNVTTEDGLGLTARVVALATGHNREMVAYEVSSPFPPASVITEP